MTEMFLRHFQNITIKYKILYEHTKDIAAANSNLLRGGVSSALDSFVVAENSVLRTNHDSNRNAEKPADRQVANR